MCHKTKSNQTTTPLGFPRAFLKDRHGENIEQSTSYSVPVQKILPRLHSKIFYLESSLDGKDQENITDKW